MSESQTFGFAKLVPGFDFLQNLAKGAAGSDVGAVITGEMNDDVAILRAAKNEPGIALVADTALHLNSKPRGAENALDPVEFG